MARIRKKDYLYHYTSFETLALILTNRTICFNSLQNVDDIEEAETEDMANFGKYVYVSCWTDDPKESIALWNLYTPKMHGVRIGLPKFPFKKHTYKAGEFYFSSDVETFIDMQKLYDDNKGNISADQPLLYKVNYTADKTLLYPHVRTCVPSAPDTVSRYINAKCMKEIEDIEVIEYSLEQLGKYKRKEWSFQKEWRYLITISPMGMKDIYPVTFETHQEFVRRIDNPDTPAPYNRFFLDLDDNAVSQMSIVLGPCMNEAEKIYVKSLLNEHGLSKNYRESHLKIREK